MRQYRQQLLAYGLKGLDWLPINGLGKALFGINPDMTKRHDLCWQEIGKRHIFAKDNPDFWMLE